MLRAGFADDRAIHDRGIHPLVTGLRGGRNERRGRAADAQVLGDGVDGAAAEDGERRQLGARSSVPIGANDLRDRVEVGAVAAADADQVDPFGDEVAGGLAGSGDGTGATTGPLTIMSNSAANTCTDGSPETPLAARACHVS